MLYVVEDNKVNLANTIIFQSVTIHIMYLICLYNGIQIMCGLKLSVIVTVGLRFFRPCVGRVGHRTLVMVTMLLMTVSRVIASVDKVIHVILVTSVMSCYRGSVSQHLHHQVHPNTSSGNENITIYFLFREMKTTYNLFYFFRGVTLFRGYF